MVFCICAITSCSDDNAYKLVNDAIDKTLSLPSFELKWEKISTFETDSSTDTIESLFEVKAENYGFENQKMYLSCYAKKTNQTKLVYQEADFCYVSSNDGDFKYHKDTIHDNSDHLSYDYICNLGYLFVKYPKEYFIDAVVSNNEDGLKTISFNVPYDFLFAEAPENFGNLKLEITIDSNGYISTLSSSYSESYSYYTYILYSDTSVFTFINPGHTVKVEPIENYETFKEITFE